MPKEPLPPPQTETVGWFGAFGCSRDLTPSDIRNYRRANLLLFGWMIVLFVATFSISWWGENMGWAAWILAGVPTVAFVVALASFAHFIRNADELTRRIQLEALAVGFAGGLVFMFGYALYERLGAPALDITDSAVAMVICYLVTMFVVQRRYR